MEPLNFQPYLLNSPLKTLAMLSSQQSLLGWGGWKPPKSTAALGETWVMLCPALGRDSIQSQKVSRKLSQKLFQKTLQKVQLKNSKNPSLID